MDLIAVVFDLRQRWIFVKVYLDPFSQGLLTSEHDRVLDSDIEIAFADFRWMRARGLQEIGDDVIDTGDFLADIFDDLTSRTGCWQITSDNLDHAGDAREWITDFMREARSHFA